MQTQTVGIVQKPVMTRDERQKKMLPPEKLQKTHAAVIGCGAIGRQVGMMLGAMGVGSLTLYDHDKIGIENMANQGWFDDQIGEAKVIGLFEVIKRMNPKATCSPLVTKFKAVPHVPFDVVFCCVDDMDARKLIAETCRDAWAKQAGEDAARRLFVDGRMAAEVLRVLTVDRPGAWEGYLGTIFSNEQAYTGSCTQQSTIYCANVIAGRMVCEYAKWLRGVPTTVDELENLLSGDRMDPRAEKAAA